MPHGKHLPGKVVISTVVDHKTKDDLDKLTKLLGFKDRATTIRNAVNKYLHSFQKYLRNGVNTNKSKE